MKSVLRHCYILISLLCSILLATGCSSSRYASMNMLAIPLQPSFQQEVMLARLDQALADKQLQDEERIPLLFQRGLLMDSLGMRVLARNDFSQILAIRPDLPEVYDILGVYHTLEGNFDAAFDSFDSVFELDPTYNNAYFNRGSTFYYAGRYEMAQKDLLAFYYMAPNEPYRTLWLYLAERELNEKQAKIELQRRYDVAVKEEWEWDIVSFYLGSISEQQLMNRLAIEVTDNTALAEHLSEVHFYLGKYYQSQGDINAASTLFKLSIANNVHNFIEHRYSLLELALLGLDQDNLSELGSHP